MTRAENPYLRRTEFTEDAPDRDRWLVSYADFPCASYQAEQTRLDDARILAICNRDNPDRDHVLQP